jgi:hypothetical protein
MWCHEFAAMVADDTTCFAVVPDNGRHQKVGLLNDAPATVRRTAWLDVPSFHRANTFCSATWVRR